MTVLIARRSFILVGVFLLSASLCTPVFAKSGGGGSRASYGGGKHTSSHGWKFSGGSGSAHKGGTYTNSSTGNRYGKHK